MTTLKLDLYYTKKKSYANFQPNMSKHVGENCGKLCISSILSSKGAKLLQKLTEIDDTRTCSNVYKKKVTCKISAEYLK